MEWMPQAVREGILTVLFISGPLVLLAAGLGLTIGVIQAATQVQEQTLGSAVKILGIFLALIIFGFAMFQFISQYASDSIQKAFRMIPGLSSHPLAPKKLFDQPLKGDEDMHHGGTDHPAPKPPDHDSHGSAANLSMLDEPEHREVNHDFHEPEVPQLDSYDRAESAMQEQEITHEQHEQDTHEAAHAEPISEPAAVEPEPVVQEQPVAVEPAPAAAPAPAQRPRPATNLNTRPATLPIRRVPRVDLNSSKNQTRSSLDKLRSKINN